MVLLVWPPPDHLWIGRKSRQFLPLSDRPTPAQVSLLRSWHYAPSCVSPAPQLKREQSLRPEFGWIRGNLQAFQRDNLRRHF
jgi:hypothetical protein